MWAACDLALYIINSKIGDSSTSSNSFPVTIHLPEMYYKPLDKPDNHTKVYIPLDTYTLASGPISAASKITSSTAVSAPVVKKVNTSAASSANLTLRLVGDKRTADHLPSNENSPTNAQVSRNWGIG